MTKWANLAGCYVELLSREFPAVQPGEPNLNQVWYKYACKFVGIVGSVKSHLS